MGLLVGGLTLDDCTVATITSDGETESVSEHREQSFSTVRIGLKGSSDWKSTQCIIANFDLKRAVAIHFLDDIA